MNALRVKITMLVVAVVFVVIGLAVGLFLALHPYPPPTFKRINNIQAYYLCLILKSDDNSCYQEAGEETYAGAPGKFGIRPEPAGGEVWEGMTKELRSTLQQRDIFATAIVTRAADDYWPVASISVPERGWFVIPIFMPPQWSEVLPFVVCGVLLIVAGTVFVSIIVIQRLTRPLTLIETSVTNIDPNGKLLMLAENGPADVRATARAINLLSSRLKEAMESRMRLVAAAGHDFRTPMTRMRLRAEFLDDANREKLLADLDELDHITDSAIGLVHEEIQDGEGETVRLDLLVRDVIAELQELQLSVRAMETEPVQVQAKPLSLKRAFRNLLVNAATHGGDATVSIRRRSQCVIVRIVDNGPGIPEALLARAFEPFFRIDTASTSGAGLGLAIAKEVIHRHRGTVVLTNRAGGGLIQTIEMPFLP